MPTTNPTPAVMAARLMSDDQHKMVTSTGRLVDPFAMAESDIHPTDIVHHLSNLCRFTGAVREPYTVAQHSMLVAGICPEPLKLAGLLHDAAETYLGDICHPTKMRGFMAPYRLAEKLILNTVGKMFGVTMDQFAAVKCYDQTAFVLERKRLMPDHPVWDQLWGYELAVSYERGIGWLEYVMSLDHYEYVSVKMEFAIALRNELAKVGNDRWTLEEIAGL